ncbi:TolC family protein [Vulcanococcus limneticus]|uniref:TolC family protein n=1 Tax=Vulcanococcus limneticus TaxID=2170428 RepID=UPI00398BD1FD
MTRSPHPHHWVAAWVALGLLVCGLPGRAAEDREPLPSTKAVDGLGVGWPAGQPLPLGELAPIPLQQLANLELTTAVDLSDRRNPVVRQAYEQLVATQNSLGAAYASWWPTINASLAGGLYGERAYYNYPGALMGVGAPATGPYGKLTSFNSSYFQSLNQFNINWDLFDPARSPTIWQNKYQVRQAVDTFVIARRDNRLRTEEAYIKLQQAAAKIITGQQLVANDQILFGLARSRVKLGVSSKLELAKQESVLKTDQVNLVNAQQTAQVAQAELAELLNVPNAVAIRPANDLAPLGSWTQPLEATITAAMGYRKVIEQKLTAVKINEAQAQIELAVYRPTISLVNSLYWTKGVGYTSLGPPYVIDARSDLWNGSTALQITFTGFDGGQARMNAAAALRRAKAAEADVQSAVNQVRREVQTYHAQAQLGRDAVLLASARVKASSNALQLQTLRFNAGYGNITDVVQAQQDLTQAVSAYLQQLTDYNLALVRLARASGLSYAPDPQLIEQVGNPLARLSLPPRLSKIN